MDGRFGVDCDAGNLFQGGAGWVVGRIEADSEALEDADVSRSCLSQTGLGISYAAVSQDRHRKYYFRQDLTTL